jgi:sphingosine kinase
VYDSVVVVSGDGLMSEVENGVMNRPDWLAVLRDNAFGHIPGGSGNGLAKSATAASGEPFDAVSMSFMICRQHTRRMDLYSARIVSTTQGEVESKGGGDESNVFWGFLGFYHGLVSDIDLESETLRCIGNARFTIYALIRMMVLRAYRGTLEYEGVAVFEGVHEESDSSARARSLSNYSSVDDAGSYSFSTCKPVRECHHCTQSSEQGLDELEAFRAAQTHTQPDDIENTLVSSSSSSSSSSAEWESVQGPFLMVTAASLPWIASDVNMTPFAHCSDGLLDLVYVTGDVGGCSMLSTFLKLEDGSHVTEGTGGPFTYVKCKAVRFTPGDCVGDDGQQSKLNVDGEEAPYGPTELRCFQAAINVFSQ